MPASPARRNRSASFCRSPHRPSMRISPDNRAWLRRPSGQLLGRICRSSRVREINLPVTAPADPPRQRRKTNAQILRPFAPRPTAGQRQPHSLSRKLFRKSFCLVIEFTFHIRGTLHSNWSSPFRQRPAASSSRQNLEVEKLLG